MGHALHHAQSSVKHFGGHVYDYIDLHHWMDETKSHHADFRHRALRHHTLGIFEGEKVFGVSITNSDGKEVPTRVILEQHVREDFSGFIPTPQDWLKHIDAQPWMQPNPAYQRKLMKSIEA